MKIDGSLARNIDFEVANLEVPKKTRRKTSILKLQSVSLTRNARFAAPTCLSRVSGFPAASPCLWGKLQNFSFFEGVKAGCHVVLRCRRGTL